MGYIHGTAGGGPGSIARIVGSRGLGYDGAMILGAAAARRPSRLRLVAACLLVACVVGGLHVFRPGLLGRVDPAVYDRLLTAVPLRPPSDRVAVVEVDERSLAEVGRWPWPRDRVARLLDRLRELGAAAVGLDVIFPEPDEAVAAPGPSGAAAPLSSRDGALAEALGRGPFVIGYAFTFGPAAERPCRLHPIGLSRGAGPAPAGGTPTVPRATGVLCSLAPLGAAARGSGFLNASPDRDGVLRRMHQIVEFRDELHPGLAIATLRAALGTRGLAVADPAGGRPTVWLDDRAFPLEADGSVLVRFRGPAGTLSRLSAVDVLEARVPARAVEGRVVFVGVSALGLGDLVATPLGTFLTGVEVHATVADNLLAGDLVRRPPGAPALELGLVLLAAVGVALGVSALGWTRTLPLALGGGLALWLGAGWALAARGWFVSPLFPTLALAGALGVAALHRLVAERERADRSARQLRLAREMMLHALTSLTETRDFETGAHLVRTSRYARSLGEALASQPKFRDFLTPETIDLIARLAPIHDIGKVGVADRTLRKAGPLSADERNEMSRHPIYGRDVIERTEERVGVRDDALLKLAKEIVYSHHERWDGSGYPEGLRGEAIPVAGRMVALVDVYDALASARVYKGALPHAEVVQAIVAGRGIQFDPDIVDGFLRIQEDWRRIAIELADEHDEAPMPDAPRLDGV
jgi:HD-GYP domain-containing protein (c-di-GMP phosphodiesterase class II)